MAHPKLTPNVEIRKVAEKKGVGIHFVLNPDAPSWTYVNDDGLQILNLCNGHNSIEDISRAISEKGDLKYDDCLGIVTSFFDRLVKNRLLQDDTLVQTTRNQFKGIALEITQRCNLRCLHCYLSAGERGTCELSLDEIKQLLNATREIGGVSVAIGGGEPLLREDLNDILGYAASLELLMSLGTNGTLIDRGMARELSKMPVKIQLSLDGATEATNDRIRGKGSYSRAIRGLDVLIDEGLAKDIVISFTPMKINYTEVPAIVEFALGRQIPVVQFPPLSPSGRARENWRGLELSDTEVLWFWEYVAKRSKELRGEMDLLADCFSISINNPGTPYRCSIGSQLRIDPNGYVYPCQCFHTGNEYVLGNVRKDSLVSIVNGERLRQVVDECFRRPLKIEECSGCKWRNFCGSGCMGVAFEENSNALSPDSCNVRKTWVERLFEDKVKEVL